MIYVTSDLHGIHPDDLQAMLEQAGFTDRDFLFILGDVIDRGQHGAELLLWLTRQTNMELILGNHEDMMLLCAFIADELTQSNVDALGEEEIHRLVHWTANGAKPTMDGLQRLLDRDAELVQGVLEYLQEAPLYEEVEAGGRKWILCHAGLGEFQPDKPLDSYTKRQLLWHRPELTERYYDDATVVFGHTPTLLYGEEYKGRAIRTDSWICIDTGAAFGGKPMLLRLDDGKEFYFD